MRKIAIIGMAEPSRLKSPQSYGIFDPGWECWVMLHDPWCYKADRVLECHTPEFLQSIESIIQNDTYSYQSRVERAIDCPNLWVTAPWNDVPHARVMPEAATFVMSHEPPQSSISWMLALAAHERPDVIGIWGVDMIHGEYKHQRANCRAWMGYCAGVGAELIIPGECKLLDGRPVYGSVDWINRRHVVA